MSGKGKDETVTGGRKGVDRSGVAAGQADERDGAPVGDAEVDGAEATESGYRRDDYWREESDENVDPAEVPEPAQGYRFGTPAERAGESDAEDGEGQDPPSPEGSNDDEHDRARLVDKD